MNYFYQLRNNLFKFTENVDVLVLPIGFFLVLFLGKFSHGWICPFKNFFHIPCPGCGLTRAFYKILAGDFKSAFYYNALSIPLFLFGIISILWIMKDLITKNNSYKKFINRNLPNYIIIIFVIITLINWIWNIDKGI